MNNDLRAKIILWRYFFLSYAALLVNTLFYLRQIHYSDTVTILFGLSIYLLYSFIYLFLVFIPVIILEVFIRKLFQKQDWMPLKHRCQKLLFCVVIVLFTFVQLFIFTDKQIFKLYHFHINGFVWNLITTPGGIESMGNSGSTIFSTTLFISGFFVLQIILFFVAKSEVLQKLSSGLQKIQFKKVFIGFIVLIFNFQFFTYGISHLEANTSVLCASNALPLYIPVTFKSWAKKFGVLPKRTALLKLDKKTSQLHYPLQPMQYDWTEPNYNIVWLVAESWRADILNDTVMPKTFDFAKKSVWFTNHYSGGNGTRMGLFSMFYGLYGNYWFDFLHHRKGPVFIDRLIEQNYQMELFTSAKFSYPEFDKTIFASIPLKICMNAIRD